MIKTSLKRAWKPAVYGTFLVLLLLNLGIPLLGPLSPRASAADPTLTEAGLRNASMRWLDINNIIVTVDGHDFRFRSQKPIDGTTPRAIPRHTDTSGKNYENFELAEDYTCDATLTLSDDGGIKGNLDMDYLPAGAVQQGKGGCVTHVTGADGDNKHPISNQQNRNILFNLHSDKTHISNVGDNNDWDFSQSNKTQYSNLFLRDNESDERCQDVMKVDVANRTYQLYEITADKGGSSGKKPPSGMGINPDCYLVKKPTFHFLDGRDQTQPHPLGNAADLDQKGLDESAADGGGQAAGNNKTDSQLDCDTKFTNPLTWIICPIVDLLASLVDALDGVITAQLSIEDSDIFCDSNSTSSDNSCDCKKADSPCQGYYKAWASFRNIALGFLVIAGLVILIAQALGTELLDAYTIRKVLPRLLIAAIGISLSWPIMQFLVHLTNDLGYGIRHLIYAPFADLPTKLELGGGGVGIVTAGIVGGAIGLGGAVGGTAVAGSAIVLVQSLGGIGALLSFIGTAFLAVFIAIMVLILRQVAIILLILVAPIAIFAYVLPNTEKYYKFWWESFSKALLMFPLIAAFIASGRVFAAVAIHNGGVLNQLVGFVAYFAPYFLLPLTFRFAGGLVRQLGGFVNDRGKGGFDRLAKYRANARERKRADLGRGAGLNEDITTLGYDKFAKRYNAMTSGAANLKNAGYNPYKMKERMAAARSTHSHHDMMKLLAEDQDLKYALSNDDIAEALLSKRESYVGSGHYGGNTDDAAEQFLRDRGYNEDNGLKEMVALHRMARRKLTSHNREAAAWIANWDTGTGFAEKTFKDQNGITRTTAGGGDAMQILADITKHGPGGDQLRANMIATSRQKAQGQRRSDWYGMSFTEQLGLAREVATEGMSTEKISEELRKGASKGKSRGEHITGRPQAIKAMVPQFIDNFDQIIDEGNVKELMQELAMAGAGQQAASQASPENAREHSKYMEHSIDITNLPADMNPAMKDVIMRAAKVKANATGQAVGEVSVQDMLDAYRGDRTLTAMVYQYGNQFAADAANAARQAAEAGQNPPTNPVPPL